MNRVKDKVAIITGATSVGIGRETALRLSREGALLIVTGRNQEEGKKTEDMVINQGGKCKYIKQYCSYTRPSRFIFFIFSVVLNPFLSG